MSGDLAYLVASHHAWIGCDSSALLVVDVSQPAAPRPVHEIDVGSVFSCEGLVEIHGAHRHRIVVQADSGILEAADLAGRRVAVNKGTSTYGGLLRFLEGRGIEPADLHLIDLQPADMPEALASSWVDAIVGSEPTPSLCEARVGRALATLGNLGSTYPILLVASEAFAGTSPDRVDGLLRSLERAAEFIRTQPDGAAAIVAQETGLSLATTARAMEYHTYRLGLTPSTTASLGSVARFLRDQGVISHLPEFRHFDEPGPPESPAAAAAEE